MAEKPSQNNQVLKLKTNQYESSEKENQQGSEMVNGTYLFYFTDMVHNFNIGMGIVRCFKRQ